MLCHEHSFELISINCARDLGVKSSFNALLFPRNGANRDELWREGGEVRGAALCAVVGRGISSGNG